MDKQPGLPWAPRPHRSISGHQLDAGFVLDLFADDEKETNSSPEHMKAFPEKCNCYQRNNRKQRLGTVQHLFLITAWRNLHIFFKQH